MDMRELLNTMLGLQEAAKPKTKPNITVHAGERYGGAAQDVEDTDSDDEDDDKAKKAEPSEKRGRGRPRKEVTTRSSTGDSSTNKKYSSDALQKATGSSLPKKLAKPTKKHTLKDWMEQLDKEIVNEDGYTSTPLPGATAIKDASGKVVATAANPQAAAAFKNGDITLGGEDDKQGMAEGDVMRHTGDKTVKVLKKAGKPIGEIGIDGDASPGGGQYYVKLYDGSLDESGFDTPKEAWEELTYAVKQGVAEAIDARYPQAAPKEYSRRLTNQQYAKQLYNKEYNPALYNVSVTFNRRKDIFTVKGNNGVDTEYHSYRVNPNTNGLQYTGFKHKENESIKEGVIKGSTLVEGAVKHLLDELISDIDNATGAFNVTGNTKERAKKKIQAAVQHDERFNQLSDSDQNSLVNLALEHYSEHGSLDESGIEEMMPAPTSVSALSSTLEENPFERNIMRSNPFESWEKQLNTLLNEGMTVTSSTGQAGAPDSVSINATDADAQELLSIVRQAGLGVFGGGEKTTSPSAYGAPAPETEPEGHGTQPELSPDVVGDGDDMLSMIKKMSGIQASGEQPTDIEVIDAEPSSDYEDEEGSEDTEQSHDHFGSEEDSEEDSADDEEEEDVEEGNAFSGAVAKAKSDNIPDAGQKFKVGGNEYPVKEEDEEHTEKCNECGMYEDKCNCGDEQVEESLANSNDDAAMQDLHYMLDSLSGGLNGRKRSQATGNITQVTTETKLMKSSTDMLVDWKKLSGI